MTAKNLKIIGACEVQLAVTKIDLFRIVWLLDSANYYMIRIFKSDSEIHRALSKSNRTEEKFFEHEMVFP